MEDKLLLSRIVTNIGLPLAINIKKLYSEDKKYLYYLLVLRQVQAMVAAQESPAEVLSQPSCV